MRIEISESLVTHAERGEDLAMQILQNLSQCQLKAYHVVWAKRNLLRRIVNLDGLSAIDKRVYSSILSSWATSAAEIHKIDYHILITYDQSTQRGNPSIVNPNEVPHFNYDFKVNMLVENILDADLYKYIGKFYLRQNSFTNISIAFESIPGGGSCTAQKYQDYIDNKEMFCVCLLDGDKKYSVALTGIRGVTVPYGETYKKVKRIDEMYLPFNCVCNGTEDVCEVENLIPVSFYTSDVRYEQADIVQKGISIDLSYYDLKRGLLQKRLTQPCISAYWETVFSAYPDIIDIIQFCEDFRNNCENSSEYSKSCGEQAILRGFGDDLLKHTLDNHAAELEEVTPAELTDSQRSEWNSIGKLIVEWCCAVKIHVNRL